MILWPEASKNVKPNTPLFDDVTTISPVWVSCLMLHFLFFPNTKSVVQSCFNISKIFSWTSLKICLSVNEIFTIKVDLGLASYTWCKAAHPTASVSTKTENGLPSSSLLMHKKAWVTGSLIFFYICWVLFFIGKKNRLLDASMASSLYAFGLHRMLTARCKDVGHQENRD